MTSNAKLEPTTQGSPVTDLDDHTVNAQQDRIQWFDPVAMSANWHLLTVLNYSVTGVAKESSLWDTVVPNRETCYIQTGSTPLSKNLSTCHTLAQATARVMRGTQSFRLTAVSHAVQNGVFVVYYRNSIPLQQNPTNYTKVGNDPTRRQENVEWDISISKQLIIDVHLTNQTGINVLKNTGWANYGIREVQDVYCGFLSLFERVPPTQMMGCPNEFYILIETRFIELELIGIDSHYLSIGRFQDLEVVNQATPMEPTPPMFTENVLKNE